MKTRTIKNDEPEDAKCAYEQSVEWLRCAKLPYTATADDAFIQAIYQLQISLEKAEMKPMELELTIKRSIHARMIVLRYKKAKKLNWSPASCAMLFMVFQQFRDMDLIVRGMRNLHSEWKKTTNKDIAPQSVVFQEWKAHRSRFPQETKSVSRNAVLAIIKKTYPKQTLRGIADATRSGPSGRPKR